MSVINTEEARHAIHPASRSAHREKQAAIRSRGNGIGSVGVLRVHALAIAREAIAGYREFAVHMADYGNDELADLFSRLFELKAEQAYQLEKTAGGEASPKPAPGEYAWLLSGSMLPAAREFIFRMMTPRQALEIAIRAEERARAFFMHALVASNDAGVRDLAVEFGHDEDAHIAWLRDALARIPEPFRPSEDCPGDPATPQIV